MEMTYTGERPVPGVMPDSIFGGVIARYVLVKQTIDGASDKKILDVGCGTGIGSGFLASCGFSVVGLDVDSESIKWGKDKKLHPELLLQEGRGEALPFDNETFDAVIAFECIEHMDSPYAFMAEAKRVLKPGGILLCSVPYGIGDVLAELLHGSSNPYHIQRFTPQTMRHLLTKYFVLQTEWGQQFHHIDHYTYAFVNHYVWRSIKRIPLLGKIFLNWRQKRNTRLAIEAATVDIQNQMNYKMWSEDLVSVIWKPMPLDPSYIRIPETLIFLSKRK